MKIQNMVWNRLFSQSFYKNKKIPLGEMSFVKDFIHDNRGDLHPLIHKSDDCCEYIKDNAYHLQSGNAQRLLGQYFPYANYEVCFSVKQGCCGFVFHIPGGEATVICNADSVSFSAAGFEEILPHECIADNLKMIVTCRSCFFDVLGRKNISKAYEDI